MAILNPKMTPKMTPKIIGIAHALCYAYDLGSHHNLHLVAKVGNQWKSMISHSPMLPLAIWTEEKDT